MINNWDPQKYNVYSVEQYHWAINELRKLDFSDKDILDIGCGDGKITAFLAQYTTGKVLGIDKNSNMIKYAKENHIQPNLDFFIDDAENIKIDYKFDLIVSFNTLHWIKDHLKFLSIIRTKLKPNGQIFFQFPGKKNAEDVFNAVNNVIASDKWNRYFKNFEFPWCFYNVSEYSHFLKLANFQEIKIELLYKKMKHEQIKGLKGWIEATWLPYINRINSTQISTFLDDITNQFIKNNQQAETIYTNMKRLQIHALKRY